jgi:exonuclease III
MRPSIKVLTFNVNGIPRMPFYSEDKTENMVKIARWLTHINPSPDIICFQEVWTTNYFKTLNEILKEKYIYTCFSNGGLAIFSKLEIMSTEFIAYQASGQFFNWNCEWLSGKGVLYGRIKLGDQIVNLYNTHLHANYNSDNAVQSYTLNQSKELMRHIKNRHCQKHDKIIICGDLNAEKDSDVYKIMTKNFNDSAKNILSNNRNNKYNTFGEKQLDYVLYKNLEIQNAFVIDSYSLSDHKPFFCFLFYLS